MNNHNYKFSLHSPCGKEVLGNSFEVPKITVSERKDQLDSSSSLSTCCLCINPILNRRVLELQGDALHGDGGSLRDLNSYLHKFRRKSQKTLNDQVNKCNQELHLPSTSGLSILRTKCFIFQRKAFQTLCILHSEAKFRQSLIN